MLYFIIKLIVTIFVLIILNFLINKLITSIFNILKKSKIYHEGIIYNYKNNKLESNNSKIKIL